VLFEIHSAAAVHDELGAWGLGTRLRHDEHDESDIALVVDRELQPSYGG